MPPFFIVGDGPPLRFWFFARREIAVTDDLKINIWRALNAHGLFKRQVFDKTCKFFLRRFCAWVNRRHGPVKKDRKGGWRIRANNGDFGSWGGLRLCDFLFGSGRGGGTFWRRNCFALPGHKTVALFNQVCVFTFSSSCAHGKLKPIRNTSKNQLISQCKGNDEVKGSFVMLSKPFLK